MVKAVDRYLSILRDAPQGESRSAGAVLAAIEQSIARDSPDPIEAVALCVAAPALIGFASWTIDSALRCGIDQLAYLSRDAQITYLIARRIVASGRTGPRLDYVLSSRRTWNLAVLDPEQLSGTPWLFNSFMRSNASDLCARLGLPYQRFEPILTLSGVSTDPAVRAGIGSDQERAMNRFLAHPEVIDAVRPRVARTRELLLGLIEQHRLSDRRTAVVDAGWSGAMMSSLYDLIPVAQQPQVMYFGYQPGTSSRLRNDLVHAYRFDMRDPRPERHRILDETFVIETFCMSDHGIVSGYERSPAGVVVGLYDEKNPAVEAWGLARYRARIFDVLERLPDPTVTSRMPITTRRLLEAFWLHPTPEEAQAWGSYPYDSDPTGTATRRLAVPFELPHRPDDRFGDIRGERAWVAGSLALSDRNVASVVRSLWVADGGSH